MKFGKLEIYHQRFIFCNSIFFMSFQVKTSGQCQLRDKKHQYFSIVSLPTDSVIVDHAVLIIVNKIFMYFAI
jgi:hypothetical protein